MTPFDDFIYLLNAVLLGEKPTIEDFILLTGTIVAFVAFILWCCFPVVPKEAGTPSQYDSRGYVSMPENKTSGNQQSALSGEVTLTKNFPLNSKPRHLGQARDPQTNHKASGRVAYPSTFILDGPDNAARYSVGRSYDL